MTAAYSSRKAIGSFSSPDAPLLKNRPNAFNTVSLLWGRNYRSSRLRHHTFAPIRMLADFSMISP